MKLSVEGSSPSSTRVYSKAHGLRKRISRTEPSLDGSREQDGGHREIETSRYKKHGPARKITVVFQR